jgi:hypothetical protein
MLKHNLLVWLIAYVSRAPPPSVRPRALLSRR